MAYTLQMAIDSLDEYRGLHETAWTLAMLKLHGASAEGPRRLRSEASRIREAFYIYQQGVDYGRP